MAHPDQPFIPFDAEMTVRDGGSGGAQKSHTIEFEDGDAQFSGDKPDAKTTQLFKSRGTNYAYRQVEDIDGVDISFTAHATHMTGSGADVSPRDVFLFEGGWSAAVSTNTKGDAKTVDLEWSGTNDGTACSLRYKYFSVESVDFSEGVPGKFSIKGKAMKLASDWKVVT